MIYVLECPCGLQYVGRTMRKLKVRVQEHINNIKKGMETHGVPLHFKHVHKMDPKGLKFTGVAHVKKHWRGGSYENKIDQTEVEWIYNMGSLQPKGLNVDLDLKPSLI